MPDLTPPFLDVECEPWPEDGDLHLWSANEDSDDSYHVATVSGDLGIEERNATAKRMAACWNACEDLPTKTLEDYSVLSLLAVSNSLLEALTLLVDAVRQDVALFPGQPHKESRLGIAIAAIEKATGKPIPAPPADTADGPFDATFDAVHDGP